MSMVKVVRLENSTEDEISIIGIMIPSSVVFTVPVDMINMIATDIDTFEHVASGSLIVHDDHGPLDAMNGWNWIQGNRVKADIQQISEVGEKIWVHNSPKPEKKGRQFYVYWTGSGDDVDNGILGGQDPNFFVMETGTPTNVVDIKFDHSKGDFYIHEGHLLWDGAGIGDYFEAFVVAEPSLVQPFANLDLILDGDMIKYAPGGSGTGTHGFAAVPSPVPNWDGTGCWDFDKKTQMLIPNVDCAGRWDLFTVEKNVARFINKIPMYSNSYGFETLDSDDTFRIFPGYFVRCTAHNISDGNWVCTFYMTAFRERTLT